MARQLSVITALLAIAAFVPGAAGTSYAGAKHKNPNAIGTLDTVVVTNYGAAFSGSVSTYLEGTRKNGHPQFRVRGTKTGLGNSSGPAHVAVSSVDQHIAVAVPFDNFGGVDFGGDISGCGPFGVLNLFGTGMVELYSPGADGNSAPENIICSPFFAEAFIAGETDTNVTGVFVPQGVAFESPFDGVHPGMDVLAVGNLFPEVIQDAEICTELMLPASSLGTITEYNVAGLPSGIDNIAPLNNHPVDAINVLVAPPTEYTQNATIGGCLSSLAGPEALAFDDAGNLFVVNNVGLLVDPTPPSNPAHIPRFVSAFPPDSAGDAFPEAVIGVLPPFDGCTTCPAPGLLTSPVGIAVESSLNPPDEEIFVTDQSDNSIKVFLPFVNLNPTAFIFQGELIATIQGSATHLNSPEGVALGVSDDALYVVNQQANSLQMYTDIDGIVEGGGGNVAPTLMVQGRSVKMNQPVGVALPQFTPSATETISALGAP